MSGLSTHLVRAVGLTATVILAGCGEAMTPSVPAANIDIIPGAVAKGSSGFTPNPLIRDVSAGTRITWLNEDVSGGTSTDHWLISDEGYFDTGPIAPGRAYTFTYLQPGTYQYHCKNHLTMTGVIVIRP